MHYCWYYFVQWIVQNLFSTLCKRPTSEGVEAVYRGLFFSLYHPVGVCIVLSEQISFVVRSVSTDWWTNMSLMGQDCTWTCLLVGFGTSCSGTQSLPRTKPHYFHLGQLLPWSVSFPQRIVVHPAFTLHTQKSQRHLPNNLISRSICVCFCLLSKFQTWRDLKGRSSPNLQQLTN